MPRELRTVLSTPVDKRFFPCDSRQFDCAKRGTINLSGLRSVLLGRKVCLKIRAIFTRLEAIVTRREMNRSIKDGSCKYEVCGQVNVINLFREEDKRAKIFVAIHAERKGNFTTKRSRAIRTNFCADLAIEELCSGSHRERSQFFASQRIFLARRLRAIKFFFAIEKIFSISRDQRRN